MGPMMYIRSTIPLNLIYEPFLHNTLETSLNFFHVSLIPPSTPKTFRSQLLFEFRLLYAEHLHFFNHISHHAYTFLGIYCNLIWFVYIALKRFYLCLAFLISKHFIIIIINPVLIRFNPQ